jgi:hypothetical protein
MNTRLIIISLLCLLISVALISDQNEQFGGAVDTLKHPLKCQCILMPVESPVKKIKVNTANTVNTVNTANTATAPVKAKVNV